MASQPSNEAAAAVQRVQAAASGSASNPAAATAASTPPTARRSFPRRVLAAYLQQLARRPLRTKMITSSFLFFLGDSMAQFGIEGRALPTFGVATAAPDRTDLAPSQASPAPVDKDPPKPVDKDAVWDPLRAGRLVLYGGLIFAPLAHNWLNLLQRVQLGSRLKTIAGRVALDQMLWGPFVVSLFWTTNGILEGKTPAQVAEKVKLAFLPVYMKSVMVFGPTACISFAFVPLQHRLLVGQTVGLGWNTYLSYINHINNKRLAAASANLSSAIAAEEADTQAHRDASAAHAAVERTQAEVERAKARHEKILKGQGGGATGVGTRMGW